MAASFKRTGLSATLFLSVLIGLPLLAAPAIIRGLAADAWVSHYASLDSLPRPRRAAARDLAARLDAVLMNLAPLPQASAAAMRVLEIGQRTEAGDHDRDAAIVIYQGVRNACARVRSRPLSGAGFAVIEARAQALENAARASAPK